MLKKIFFYTFFLLSFFCYSQNSKKIVSITVATKKINCMTSGTDVDFGFASGFGSVSEIRNKSIIDAKKRNPNYIKLRTYSNYITDYNTVNHKGDYSVIIKTKGKGPGCTLMRYGIGFGTNRDKALKSAISNARIHNPYWKESYGYEIIIDRSIY